MTTVFIVPHTHWDREWYDTAARFRQRLIPVVDEIIDVLSRDATFSCFLLDGQAAILDDYLALRPDRRPAITSLVKDGRLLVGPWYVLSDEILSSDECLVRNLLAGRHVAEAVGGWLKLGYSPDAFGHPAALPTILAGFDIRYGILWRGYGGEPGQEGDTLRWAGPDGASVTFHHLPPSGYEIGSGLPHDATRLVERWHELDAILAPRAASPVRLITAGADHHAIDAGLPGLLVILADRVPGHQFRIASPLDYFDALPPSPAPPTVRGELRFSYRYAWTLQDVHSTRAGIKRAIAESDRLLVRWAEPQVALAGTPGHRPLLAAAWKDHLLNHPHDSLGGCVADDVAKEVSLRAGAVSVQARGLLVDAVHDRLAQDRSLARRSRERWKPALVLVNPRPTPVSGVVEATVTVFQDDVPVGPDSAHRRAAPITPVRLPSLLGPDDKPVPLQVLGEYDAFERLDSRYDYPDQDRVRAFRVALLAKDVPALGLQRLLLTSPLSPLPTGEGEYRIENGVSHPGHGFGTGFETSPVPGHHPSPAGRGAGGEVDQDGIEILLQSDRDKGDTYTFQPVKGDRPIRGRWSSSRVVWPGPLVFASARDVVVGDRVRATVHTRSDAGSRLTRLAIDGANLAGNHRLRILFPLPKGLVTDRSTADMQYGPVTRERCSYDPREFPREWPAVTAPMHRYVSVADASGRGLTVFTRGMFEYELTPDGALAVTLLRGVGDLSRGDLDARPGHAGWPLPTPAAQEQGPFRVELATAPIGVSDASSPAEWENIERLAEEFHAPLAGLMLRYGIDLPPLVEGPQLVGPGLAFKALKLAEDGTGVVARCVNLTASAVAGSWLWHEPVGRAVLARLDETELEELKVEGDRWIPFLAGPRAVTTIIVDRKR